MSDNTNNQNNTPYQSQDSNPYKNREPSPEMISSQNNYSNGQPHNAYQNGGHQPIAHTGHTKFCKFCASVVPFDAVICTACGRQIEELKSSSSSTERIIINNTNTNTNANVNPAMYGREKNKWVAFLLCLFLGVFGVHKFYEGKIFMGLLYLFTFGFGTLGVFIDLIVLLLKPNPYYV